MHTFEYTPENVCARKITITVDDNKIIDVSFLGGCNGNTQGVASLLKGMDIDEAIRRLEGIPCRGSRTGKTSCPDQLANALKTLRQLLRYLIL